MVDAQMMASEAQDGPEIESEDMIISKRELKASTQKVIRQFSKRENRLLLQAFRGDIKTSD